jgi:hypothetical protein
MAAAGVLTENQKERIKRQVCVMLPGSIASSHSRALLVLGPFPGLVSAS